MADPRTEPRGGAPKGGWRVAFLASLALNLLVIGVVAGSLARGEDGLRTPPRIDVGSGPYARALGEADRRAVALAVRQSGAGRELGPRARRAAMETLVTALRAEPFDLVAVSDLLAGQRRKSEELVAVLETAILERIGAMSAAERIAFADRLEAELRRGPGGPGRGGGPGAGDGGRGN